MPLMEVRLKWRQWSEVANLEHTWKPEALPSRAHSHIKTDAMRRSLQAETKRKASNSSLSELQLAHVFA